MGWIIVCFLGMIMYACCIVSSKYSRYEEAKQIEDMINQIEKK